MITFGSLFAGQGGFDLGFERAGLKCKWQVEINEHRRRLLQLRFPGCRQHDDITTFPPVPELWQPDGTGSQRLLVQQLQEALAAWRVDVLCGGFPCQDISLSGYREGIDGKRSGLWSEYVRIIRLLRPRIVVVENVAALLIPSGGRPAAIGRVLGDLAESGLDAEWDCFPASAFGAYHERDRIILVAYAASVNGRPHDLLEAGREWGASLQLRRLSGMAVAERGQRENTRLRCEPRLARLVRRVPGAMERLEGNGNSIWPGLAEFVGRRIVNALAS